MRRARVCVCLLPLVWAGVLCAQANRATITGTVTDSSGALIVGVEVTAKNLGTNVLGSTLTNAEGIYSIPNLFPGAYSLEFKKQGFKPLEYPTIKLESTQVAQINAALQLGAVTEVVTVTTDAPVLDRESAVISTNMNGNVITDLPLNIYGGRQIEAFAVAITPGYSPSSNPYWAVINGTQGFTKDITVDGTSATAQIQGDSMEIGPSMEAVQEMQAETSGLGAESGITNGGVIAFNLKSGTNRLHGSAFGFSHNEVLDANTWDNNNAGIPRPKARFWDYGFSAGGPIRRNKTFIFGAFERFTQNDFTPAGFGSAATVPPQAFLGGDFSALLGAQLCTQSDGSVKPGCGAGTTPILVQNDSGQTVPLQAGMIFDPQSGNQFTGNQIPSTRFSSVAQKIVPLYQKSYAPERSNLIQNDRLPNSNSPAQTPNQAVIKVDHNLRVNDRLSGSWVYNHRPRTLVDSGGIWAPGSTDGGPLANSRVQLVYAHEFRASEQHMFSTTLTNVFNATYNWYWNGSIPASSGQNWPQTLGFGSTGENNFPVINFGAPVNGIQETSIGNSWQGHYVGATLILGDQVMWNRGRHAFAFGGDFRAMQLNSTAGSGLLTFNFSPDQTGAPLTPYGGEVGFGFASFLLGNVHDASESTAFNLYGRRKADSFFASDSYKLKRNLTLNMGLRWELTYPFHEKYGHWANFDLSAIGPLGIPGSLVFANGGGDSFEKMYHKNFAPQIGAAYNPWQRVVFRGSYGILYAPLGIQSWSGVPYGFAPGFQGTNRVNAVANNPAFNWDSGYPGVFVPGTKDPNNIPWGPVSIDPRSLELGYTHNFNGGVQYALNSNTRVEAAYVGNRGRRLHDPDLEFNQPDPTKFLSLYNSPHFYDWVTDTASAAAAGVPFPYSGFQGFAFQAIAPYPQITTLYSPIFYVGTPKGVSGYDSLVLQVVKKTGRGLTMDFSYTLSRSVGDVLTNFAENWWNGSFQNFYDLSPDERTLTSFDQKHAFKGYFAYELPFGQGRQFLANRGRFLNSLVGGWSVSGLFLYASGNPLFFYSGTIRSDYAPWAYVWSAVYMNYNLAGYGGRKFDPSHFAVPSAGNPTPAGDLYFPSSVASDPAAGTLGAGPAAVDQLRGFGTASEDASILKYFRFGNEGRYALSLRVEFYNLFNRHSFANPITDNTSSQFGYVTGVTGSPRQGQFGARFTF